MAVSAFAWPGYSACIPEAFDPGDTMGYFIWRDRAGFHLWVTTYDNDERPGGLNRDEERHFMGMITTDGEFTHVDLDQEEGNDRVKIRRDDQKIGFDLTTQGQADGLNFRVRGADWIKFTLYIDGEPAESKRIFVGEDNYHPEDNSFVLRNRDKHNDHPGPHGPGPSPHGPGPGPHGPGPNDHH